MPPPTPVDTTMAMKFSTPAAAPTQPSPRARALASLSTNVSSPVASASRARSGNSRHAGMLRGDTVSPPADIGPPQPTPHTTISPLPMTLSITASSTENSRSPSSTRDGAVADATTSPSAVTSPAASLVPPMSTARAVSTRGEGITTPPTGSRGVTP